jgi:hypothetical protein
LEFVNEVTRNLEKGKKLKEDIEKLLEKTSN